MGIRKKCLIITLLCFSSLMHASEFMFKHLEVKDGLSNNQVLDIFKDSEGFMWFATASGLNRYDGCQMTLFRSNNADPASLPDNYIKSIQEDYKGNLWILTGVGYVIYNSESETFDREVHAWLCEVGIDGTPVLVYIDHNKKYVVLYKKEKAVICTFRNLNYCIRFCLILISCQKVILRTL